MTRSNLMGCCGLYSGLVLRGTVYIVHTRRLQLGEQLQHNAREKRL